MTYHSPFIPFHVIGRKIFRPYNGIYIKAPMQKDHTGTKILFPRKFFQALSPQSHPPIVGFKRTNHEKPSSTRYFPIIFEAFSTRKIFPSFLKTIPTGTNLYSPYLCSVRKEHATNVKRNN